MILAILAIAQDVTRPPNDQIRIARAMPGGEPSSAQIGGDVGVNQLSMASTLSYSVPNRRRDPKS